MRLSEATVQRTPAEVGHRIATLLSQGIVFGPAVDGAWHRAAWNRRVAYFTIAATGTRQQGPPGVTAEGRMAYVAGVSNPAPPEWLRPSGPAPPLLARYLSGLYPLAAMGPRLRRPAAPVGLEPAPLWIALTDGGLGLEEFCQQNCNRADLIVILDFSHAATYLTELARALHPGAEAPAKEQGEQGCRLLKAEGGATMLAVLREWTWPARRSAALGAQGAKVEEYFTNNLHRMAYPEYEAEGWQIGSGVVASACKPVVGQRLKGAGRRWGEAGAQAWCHVRALYRSAKGQWAAFWSRNRTKTKVYQLN